MGTAFTSECHGDLDNGILLPLPLSMTENTYSTSVAGCNREHCNRTDPLIIIRHTWQSVIFQQNVHDYHFMIH